MKKNIVFILLFASSIIIFSTGSLYSQDTTSKVSPTDYMEISLYYINKSYLPLKNNEFVQTGNNFIGFELNRIALITKIMAAEMAVGIQFGNIGGEFALAGYVKPGLSLVSKPTNNLLEKKFDLSMSTGLIFYSIYNYSKLLYFGVNPEIGISLNLYDGIYLKFRAGAELYSNISYINFGLGLSYRWQE